MIIFVFLTNLGTCCEGFTCQYGHCTKGVKEGEPGTYCDRTSDCLGKESCCVREISINPHTSLCKPLLDEFESCGPINLFHHIYNGGMVEPDCGPCKAGLQCKNVGYVICWMFARVINALGRGSRRSGYSGNCRGSLRKVILTKHLLEYGDSGRLRSSTRSTTTTTTTNY